MHKKKKLYIVIAVETFEISSPNGLISKKNKRLPLQNIEYSDNLHHASMKIESDFPNIDINDGNETPSIFMKKGSSSKIIVQR